jgi:hypothetical protein
MWSDSAERRLTAGLPEYRLAAVVSTSIDTSNANAIRSAGRPLGLPSFGDEAGVVRGFIADP